MLFTKRNRRLYLPATKKTAMKIIVWLSSGYQIQKSPRHKYVDEYFQTLTEGLIMFYEAPISVQEAVLEHSRVCRAIICATLEHSKMCSNDLNGWVYDPTDDDITAAEAKDASIISGLLKNNDPCQILKSIHDELGYMDWYNLGMTPGHTQIERWLDHLT